MCEGRWVTGLNRRMSHSSPTVWKGRFCWLFLAQLACISMSHGGWSTGWNKILYATLIPEQEQWPLSACAMHWKINEICKDLFISYDYLHYSPKKCWLGLWGCTSLLKISVRQFHRPMTHCQYRQVAVPKQLSPVAPPALLRDALYHLQVGMKQTFHAHL